MWFKDEFFNSKYQLFVLYREYSWLTLLFTNAVTDYLSLLLISNSYYGLTPHKII
jgi:hypothetical protein